MPGITDQAAFLASAAIFRRNLDAAGGLSLTQTALAGGRRRAAGSAPVQSFLLGTMGISEDLGMRSDLALRCGSRNYACQPPAAWSNGVYY